MPLPHCCPVIVVTPLLLEKHVVLILLPPIALQMLPILHGLKSVTPVEVEGFMMYFAPASQVLELRGQHWVLLAELEVGQVVDVH